MAGPVQFERRVFPVGAPMDLVSGASSPTDLTFTVASVDDSVPTTGPGYVIFDLGLATEDASRWISRSGVTFTIPDTQSRGVAGTTATGHSPGSGNVVFAFVCIDFDEANYWANQLGQIQAPGDMYQGAGDNILQVTPIGSEGQRWVVTDGIGGWVDPELPASATDGWVLTQVDDLPVWQAPVNPLLVTAAGDGPYAITGTPAALDLTNLTVSFVVPASGVVIWRASGQFLSDTSGFYAEVWPTLHGTSTQVGAVRKLGAGSTALFDAGVSVARRVTGLTPGATVAWDLWGGATGTSDQHFSDILIEISAAV